MGKGRILVFSTALLASSAICIKPAFPASSHKALPDNLSVIAQVDKSKGKEAGKRPIPWYRHHEILWENMKERDKSKMQESPKAMLKRMEEELRRKANKGKEGYGDGSGSLPNGVIDDVINDVGSSKRRKNAGMKSKVARKDKKMKRNQDSDEETGIKPLHIIVAVFILLFIRARVLDKEKKLKAEKQAKEAHKIRKEKEGKRTEDEKLRVTKMEEEEKKQEFEETKERFKKIHLDFERRFNEVTTREDYRKLCKEYISVGKKMNQENREAHMQLEVYYTEVRDARNRAWFRLTGEEIHERT